MAKNPQPTEDIDASVDTNTPKSSKAIEKIKSSKSHWDRLKVWYVANKKKSIPLTVLAVILLILIIPWTRYQVVGLVYKKDFAIKVQDSKTHTAVSGAAVSAGSASALTDGSGQAKLHVSVGPHTFHITKKYYKDQDTSQTVPILSQKLVPSVNLSATGRQVKIKVTNVINHKILADVEIKVAGTSAKTDNYGTAIIVLPVGVSSQKATLSLDGYNSAQVTVAVSDKEVKDNDYSLAPSGKIYFLSKLSGKIDVVKTDLDGANRQTVYAGTGKEEDNSTVLLASRDWKYLALLSRHDTDLPQLYLIETATDKVTVIDQGNATFSLVGWSNGSFVYQVTRNSYTDWQPKKFALKSFNAETKQLNILDQTDAAGDAGTYAQEQLGNVYTMSDGTVVYSKVWYKSYSAYPPNTFTNGKQNGIYSVRTDGGGKKSLKTFDASGVNSYSNYITSQPGKPDEVYFSSTDANSTATYLEYKDGNLGSITVDDYPSSGVYYTYLLSPSGKQTFWSEERDGKNTMFVGTASGANGKTIASLSDYQTYGWFSDNYLLISKNSSQLYIIPVTGLASGQQPVKITDYHKPAQNYYGYGGGYGGI
jgi:hypothetical protein